MATKKKRTVRPKLVDILKKAQPPPMTRDMTLRDWFAGMVLNGWIQDENLDITYRGEITEQAYLWADQMMMERTLKQRAAAIVASVNKRKRNPKEKT